MPENEGDELGWAGDSGGGGKGGLGVTSPRGVLKKTKAAPRRRIQCAESRGHFYTQLTKKRDLFNTRMETF